MAVSIALAAWVACVAVGFCALQQYAAGAGQAFSPRGADDFIASHRRPGRPLAVIAVHPHCPCTSASLAEFGDFLARSRGDCDALILQYRPKNPAANWKDEPLPRELGGCEVQAMMDDDGRTAALFGAATSGHVVLIDAQGAIRFSGGITTARGHRGFSSGQEAMLLILKGGAPAGDTAPVFGCALQPECSAPPQS